MKAPRYLLREIAVKRMIRELKLKPGKFLEIGYGEGEMLLTLAKAGFWGEGYDLSNSAREKAAALLREHGAANITLLEKLDNDALYDYIFFFEVIGYWENPANEMLRLKGRLKPEGKMIFSFANKRFEGYAAKVTGNAKCFSREEIMDIIKNNVGLKVDLVWNYGFPLANITKPFLDMFHKIRYRPDEAGRDIESEIKNSGLSSRFLPTRAISLMLNPVTIYPFAVIQFFFRNTDLGNGYVVAASKPQER